MKKVLGFGIFAVVVLLIILIVFQVRNAEKNAEIERELQRIQNEKEFCDNLEISLGNGDIGMGIPAGVNYAFCSNEDTTATAIVTLNNGLVQTTEERLQDGSCMLQQIMYWNGFDGSGYNGMLNCVDIKSIELISDRCPQVKVIVTDMSEITCGI